MRTLALLVILLSASSPLAADVTQIDTEGLKNLLAQQSIILVDVRTPGEWRETGVIAGSHLLTFFDEKGRYDARAWLDELAKIAGPAKPVAVICAVGSRSRAISVFLEEQAGYKKVYDASQGIRAWINAGYPTVRAPN
jgi:rhodanese-related sulfurtransferase